MPEALARGAAHVLAEPGGADPVAMSPDTTRAARVCAEVGAAQRARPAEGVRPAVRIEQLVDGRRRHSERRHPDARVNTLLDGGAALGERWIPVREDAPDEEVGQRGDIGAALRFPRERERLARRRAVRPHRALLARGFGLARHSGAEQFFDPAGVERWQRAGWLPRGGTATFGSHIRRAKRITRSGRGGPNARYARAMARFWARLPATTVRMPRYTRGLVWHRVCSSALAISLVISGSEGRRDEEDHSTQDATPCSEGPDGSEWGEGGEGRGSHESVHDRDSHQGRPDNRTLNGEAGRPA